LNQIKRASIVSESNPISRYLETILKKSKKPTKKDHSYQWQMFEPAEFLLHLQVAIPGKSHKDIGYNQQENGIKTLHTYYI